MPAILGHHHTGSGVASDLGNVCVVEPASDDAITDQGIQEVQTTGGWQLTDGPAGQDVLPQDPTGIRRRQAVLRGQAGRDGEELEAAVPGCRRWRELRCRTCPAPCEGACGP